jgi:hypothetical protein
VLLVDQSPRRCVKLFHTECSSSLSGKTLAQAQEVTRINASSPEYIYISEIVYGPLQNVHMSTGVVCSIMSHSLLHTQAFIYTYKPIFMWLEPPIIRTKINVIIVHLK